MTQQHEETQQNYEDSYVGAPLDEKTSKLSITLDDSDILFDLYKALTGKYEKRDGTLGHDKSRQLMNERGAQAVILNLRSRIDKSAKLGYLDQRHKDRLMMGISRSIIVMIAQNTDKFAIDVQRRTDITWMILDMADLNLSRALGGKERDHAYIDQQLQRLQQQSHHTQTIEGKKFSMFGGSNKEQARQEGY